MTDQQEPRSLSDQALDLWTGYGMIGVLLGVCGILLALVIGHEIAVAVF